MSPDTPTPCESDPAMNMIISQADYHKGGAAKQMTDAIVEAANIDIARIHEIRIRGFTADIMWYPDLEPGDPRLNDRYAVVKMTSISLLPSTYPPRRRRPVKAILL
jgi:hypothetical protein